MPELLSAALKSKLSWAELKKDSSEDEKQKMKDLISKLTHFSQILYEKS